MKPIGAGRMLALLHKERALAVAKSLSLQGSTAEQVAAEAHVRRIEPRLVAAALTVDELRMLCAHRGVVPGPGCSREQMIELAVGDGPPGCEVAYLPWWGNPHES